MPTDKDNLSKLWNIGLLTLKELETEKGILASGKEEIFGCIFGRDSLITSLSLLSTYKKTKDPYFLSLVKKILTNLVELQGKEVNIQSGEEPGKCIHEYRQDGHEHLTKRAVSPWYVYEDNTMRNYDTVDATPLLLMAIYEYYRLSNDSLFIEQAMPNINSALDWILAYGDINNDGFIDYRFHPDRISGGLTTQSWMDSSESLFHEDGQSVIYPIAPVEVQSYVYVAMKAWAHYFKDISIERSLQLEDKANSIKELFNQRFIIRDGNTFSLAFALDGEGRQLTAARSSMGHCLWASWENEKGYKESILDERYIPLLIKRLMAPDLFVSKAGMRTLSSGSKNFDPYSYHNGSIWPHDTSIIIAGMETFGFNQEATELRLALMSAYTHFQTPIELFVFTDGEYKDYCSLGGQIACKKQAWSAASLVAGSFSDIAIEK
jgi:glycogen debranching enzyme